MTTDAPRLCDQHTWVAIGVTTVDGAVTRVWSCENCPAWTRQELDERFEIDWSDANIQVS